MINFNFYRYLSEMQHMSNEEKAEVLKRIKSEIIFRANNFSLDQIFGPHNNEVIGVTVITESQTISVAFNSEEILGHANAVNLIYETIYDNYNIEDRNMLSQDVYDNILYKNIYVLYRPNSIIIINSSRESSVENYKVHVNDYQYEELDNIIKDISANNNIAKKNPLIYAFDKRMSLDTLKYSMYRLIQDRENIKVNEIKINKENNI